jgi:Dihydropteroate synthase and related enzymes
MAGGKGPLFLLTGKLAAPSLRQLFGPENTPSSAGRELRLVELPISVAALMTPEWALHRLRDAGTLSDAGGSAATIVLPGRCGGDFSILEEAFGVSVLHGPDDLWDLPAWLAGESPAPPALRRRETKIVAEVVDAWRLSADEILRRAERLRDDGADLIDLGGEPGGGLPAAAEKVALLKRDGFAVSVDSFNTDTIRTAADAGADLILSVDGSNLDVVRGLPCPVVVVPDCELPEDSYRSSLERNVRAVEAAGGRAVADPILSPPLAGFVRSLGRYRKYRRTHPGVPMLMGLGNVTELLEADSAGVNALLAVCAAELGIEYVLTTEVAPWTRGTVRELALALDVMYTAGARGSTPRRLADGLRQLKGTPPRYEKAALRGMQAAVADLNWRIFVVNGEICVFNNAVFLHGTSPDEIFAGMAVSDVPHAFYLGRELERAATALRLHRDYAQDNPLAWGVLP